MIGIYFSGTGNTKHCIEKLVKLVEGTAIALPLEGDAAVAAITKNNVIYFGYGVRGGDMPYFVRDFIVSHKDLWKGKNIFCIACTDRDGGDGAGRGARLFKKYGATVLGGLHIRMPDNVCDFKEKKRDYEPDPKKIVAETLKFEENLKKKAELSRVLVKRADEKIENSAKKIRGGKYPSEGLGFFSRLSGFKRRCAGGSINKGYNAKLKINENLCDGCHICAEQCPVNNLTVTGGKAEASGRCTACYRCINKCPRRAITLTGDLIAEQYRLEKYQ